MRLRVNSPNQRSTRWSQLELLVEAGVETSATLGVDAAHSTVRSPVLARLPERRTRRSFRCVYSHGSWFRSGPFSWASRVGCGPAPRSEEHTSQLQSRHT